MLEGLVANLLNRFLGMYVKNFDPKQLNVGIWSGDVKLRNLELRREALDQLRLPINVVEGRLGVLTLSIPWSNLRGKPVRVNIEDVFLLAAPKEEDDYDAEEEEKRAVAVKLEKLESAELLKEQNTEAMSAEEQQKSQSFTQSFVTAIVDNLQVSIKNVHVRYEDSIATPGHAFAVGLTLKEMSAVSTDADWQPTFIQSTSGTTHKLAVLNSLALYWNSDADLFGTGKGGDVGAEAQEIDKDELIRRFKQGIEETAGHQYLLKPVSGRAGIELDKTGHTDKPKTKARLLFQELGFIIDEDQYRDALMLVDLMHYFVRHHEYKKNAPKETPKENPRAWVKFAGQAVLDKIHERNRKWTWDYFKERRDTRRRYIELFKKKKKEQKFTEQETKDMTQLEHDLSYEDLRFWRSLARSQLRKENVGVKKPPPKQTWSSWVWGSKPQEKQEDDDAGMTEQQRKELYQAIDWDEKKALADAVDLPRETIKLQVESSLRTGSFTLKRDPHGQSNDILKLVFDNFKLKALQRPDSLLADVALGGFRVYDGTTEGTLFPQIVKVKGAEEQPKEGVREEDTQTLDGDDDSEAGTTEKAEEDDSLFHLVFENNPLDESADTKIDLRLKSLEFIHNPKFVVEIVKFFKPPERQMESIGALLETAGASIEEIRQQTRAGLEFALEEHKTINANLDIHAPIFIIPESITEESTLCMILDAGHVSLNSELVDKDTMRDIHSKQKQQYTEDDYKQLEGLMYDKFHLKLESTQVLIGPGIEATRAQLEAQEDSQNMHIIDRINMAFLLENSIIPKAPDVTKIRISGSLPVLHASISDKKYKNLMRLIDVAIPRFESTEPQPNGNVVESRPQHVVEEQPASKRKSVQLLEAKDLPVIDHDSDTEDNPPETPNETDTPANIHQRNFEIKFTVEKLQASLYKADPDGKKPDQLLVELVAEHFYFDFYLRPYDMVAEVLLRSLSVDDHIEEQPLPEFKQIISSKGFKADDGKDLLNVKFVKVNPASPEFTSTYEGIATNLDVSVSTINVVVTRRTLLTLLDFVLTTFASPGGQQPIEGKQNEDEPEAVQESPQQSAPADKIRIKAELSSIALILNNDGVRLATLSLNSGDVGIFLNAGTMQIKARLGSLSLVDDINEGAPEDSPLRRLIAIEGDDLADFKYQTFDSSRRDYPGYDSGIYLRSGSIKINFMEEPFRKIMEFGVKFGKMQAIFNAARQAAADQAQQVQESAQKMHFDVVIKTPIVVFPGVMVDDRPRDLLTAYLGEIYASNKFVRVQGQRDGPLVNKLTAGIRHIRLTSEFHYDNGNSQELEMIDKVDLDFKIRYLEHQSGLERPDLEIEGSMSPINLRVSQTQVKFLMELSKTIPAAFATEDESEEDIAEELPTSTTESAAVSDPNTTTSEAPATSSYQAPELGTGDETWTKLNLVFNAPMVSLELILAEEGEPIENLEAASLSKFAINETGVKLRMLSDGALEAELMVHSFTIRDSRTKETNKFRKIMSLINNDVQQQFMANVSISGGEDRHMIVMLTIDSPRIIVALDYVFALQAFANTALQSSEPPPIAEQEELTEDGGESPEEEVAEAEDAGAEVESDAKPSMTVSFRVNVVDAQIILIANPTISNTEAIVLGTKEVLVSQQNATTLQITKIGMFLCRMDRFETSRLRILDDFSASMSMEKRSQGKDSWLTSIHIGVEPLVLRLSLRDILLAMQIVSKASSTTPQPKMQQDTEPKKLKDVKASSKAPSTKRKSIAGQSTLAQRSKRSKSTSKPSQSSPQQQRRQWVVLSREEMTAEVDGIRVILIGDMHELPMLDWSVKKFDVEVHDWSSSLTADTRIDTFINVYNFSKSAWEPLIEPWNLGFHMAKQLHPEVLSMELYSHKNMELTVTTATIALASKSFTFLSTDEDILSKPRVADAPYRIRNYTGFDLSVWADEKSDSAAAAKLTDGEEYAWRFQDTTSMRESLSPEGNAGLVGVKLEGSGFDSVTRIPVIREGETLYNLKPKKDGVQHRMLVEVALGTDNVKYITFRSPLLVENKTQIPIEVGVFSPEEGHLLKIEKIAPGEARPAPVGAAFVHSLVLRPDQGFGYGWSNERLFWKDLLKRSTRAITCESEAKDESPAFFFQMHASYDEKDPITKVYPYMRIQISAPVEIQNLLPYDFKYRIYDKNTKKDWTNFLRKGGVSPVHVVELSHLLLLSVDVEDAPFKQSDFAIINSNTQEDFRREKVVQLKDERGAQLRLKLHYTNIKNSGGAFRVSVFSPYVLLNKTGLDMSVQSKAFFGSSSKSSSTHGARSSSGEGKALPMLYSYGTDDRKNRSLLRIGDSAWSKPQSFDAIGSSYEVVLPAASGNSELHAGVSVAEGEGKYSLTKVVTIAPRFVLKNKIGEEIELREPGSSEVWKMQNNELRPVYFMRQSPEKQLCLCFPGGNNQWSSPFNMDNVGMTHVKLAKHGQRQKLVRVEVILEDATLFLHFSIETKHWPFSMRNESDTEFLFFQANPNLAEDEEEDRGSGWKPIRYRLPARSIMPYAWDYPASKNKELVLTARGKERYVKLAEIGNLIPIKLPPDDRGGPMKVIDVNIVADGPTQTLVLSNYQPSKSLYRQKTGQTVASQTSLNQGFEVKQIESEVNFKAELRLAGFGISLVNSKLKELMYITFREMELKYGDSKLYQTVNFTVKWIQIDNQLYGGIFPILLYPSVVPKTGKELEAHPIFHAMVTRVKDDSYGVLYIKYATLLLQQITVELDEDFIFAMLDFVKVPGASWSEEKEGKLCDESVDVPEPTREQQGEDVYFELLHLQPIQLDLSFVRTERVNAEDNFVNSPLMFFVNVMTMSIGNVNDAPIRFNALLLENARISVPALMTNIQNHYTQEALRQVHIILGSADFLGNPVGLFNNISSGVADIFYEPYQGLVMTDRPQELGIGIAKGASSFVKKSVFGFSDSMAKFSGSISKGLAAATMDKEFQDQRRMAKNRNRPKHALYGVTAGGSAFAASMASGIGGLARHPLEGAEKEGALGFVKGVGKGVLGLATKPAIGAFDLASNVAEGVRNTTTVFDAEGLDRVRLSRFIGMDGIVRPYSQREALGQFWLKTCNDGQFFNEEYIAHLELEGRDMLVIITYDRILMLRTKKLRMEWDVKLTDIKTISKERTGMSIGLKGGVNGPFIPVADEGSRNWLYRQIAIGESYPECRSSLLCGGEIIG
ncbi:Vacuolar protein sorting-associated protein 13 [Cladophialophora carrionii]|uniref:Vacuolar protein sorting-associated protein n=1 Tax=Cladophialophora carrionii TaxID=86049 RepID=A0A1C1CJ50_9EURO|nr:Vacuolar protein sorting-associated protein 13 [Cladophialophora carrionii]